jgi:hypothetical protein
MASALKKPTSETQILKKHVSTIHAVADLSALQRKLVNALLFNAYDGDCSKSGGFALIASEKRLDRGLYGVVSLSAWGRC